MKSGSLRARAGLGLGALLVCGALALPWLSARSPDAAPDPEARTAGARTALREVPVRRPSGLPAAAAARSAATPGLRAADGEGPAEREARRAADAPAPRAAELVRGAVVEADAVAELEQALRRTEEALDASRRLAEETALRGHREVPVPGRDASEAARAAAASLAPGCAGEGAVCRSSAECCAGLACAGGVPGFATAGRCEEFR